MKTTIPLPPLCVRANLGSVNEESRTVELIFSTGAPVERFDYGSGRRYLELLSLQPGHVRLDRLNAGAPLLDAHSGWSIENVIGTVEPGTARVDGRQATARVRFSKRADVEPIWRDVLDKIIRAVSVGYRVHKLEEKAGKDGGLMTRTATDWEPYEISLVPMPADAGAHVRKGEDQADANACEILREDNAPAPPSPGAVSQDDAARCRRLEAAKARAAADPAPPIDYAAERRRTLAKAGIFV